MSCRAALLFVVENDLLTSQCVLETLFPLGLIKLSVYKTSGFN